MNYPCGIKKTNSKIISYGNRGMSLEADINLTNDYYLKEKVAVIHKKPTPITICKVDYPSRYEAVIKEGYFKTPSTTDYNGIYKGKYIDFEAKETKNKKIFPLSNIHKHQLDHLKSIISLGGIGFIIIRFTTLNETFLIEGNHIFDATKNEKKSLDYDFVCKKGYLIKVNYNPRLDYLKIIDHIYFGGDINE
ncbi:MAG: Holliday junction resolvase RecU [Bacilli bacterium]|nr:Holliday junction resolvase RecU [Bacilli bacterium]